MIPTKIALLTDSSADLRWEEARENNIFFVPLRILCQDGEYLDGVDILVPSPSKTGDYSRPNPFNINGTYKVTVYLVDGSVNTLASAEGYYNSNNP